MALRGPALSTSLAFVVAWATVSEGRQDTSFRSSRVAIAEERGEPLPMDLAELAASGPRHDRVSVRVQARLEPFPHDAHYLVLSEGASRVLVIPSEGELGDLNVLLGRDVEMVGLARELKPPQEDWCRLGHWSLCDEPRLPRLPDLTPDRLTTWPQVSITPFRITDATPFGAKKKELPLVSLEALVTVPGRRDGQVLRVVGRFRGHNLFGDLPARSRRNRRDWVIKDSVYAVWVLDKPSKGKGWSLDGSDRSVERWVEVSGRPETVGGVTYLHAERVNLAAAPVLEPPADRVATAAPPRPPPPAAPPRIMFAMPLDGDDAVAADVRFVVQFSKDMEEGSFAGRVLLAYAGPPRPGDRGFPALKVEYEPGRRALTVDPGDALRAGRELELRLLPGIVDTEGLELVPRSEAGSGERLSFRVATP